MSLFLYLGVIILGWIQKFTCKASGRYNSSLNNRSTKNFMEFIKISIVALIFATFILTFLLEIISIEGSSMEPTFQNGNKVLIEKLSLNMKKPTYEDIIVFKYPADPTKKFIKRVLAVEGDRIKIQNNKIFINGNVKNEAYIFEKRVNDFNEIVIPKDTVFVLGDNRNNSKDSRSKDVGLISLKLVVAKAVYKIYPIKMIGRVK
jgi:signal peptidase I